MKHAIIFALALFLFPRTVAAQNCYVRLTDASGYTPTAGQLDALEQAAAALCAVFDSAGFGGQFKVYDFGFYQHHEATTGGYPEPFARKVEEVAGLSPYYLVFGREANGQGTSQRFWVEAGLPDSGIFYCINQLSPALRDNLSKKYGIIANEIHRLGAERPENKFHLAEIGAMDSLRTYIFDLMDCCDGEQRAVSPSCNACVFTYSQISQNLLDAGFATTTPLTQFDTITSTGISASIDGRTNLILDIEGDSIELDKHASGIAERYMANNPDNTIKIFLRNFSDVCINLDATLTQFRADNSDAKVLMVAIPDDGGSKIRLHFLSEGDLCVDNVSAHEYVKGYPDHYFDLAGNYLGKDEGNWSRIRVVNKPLSGVTGLYKNQAKQLINKAVGEVNSVNLSSHIAYIYNQNGDPSAMFSQIGGHYASQLEILKPIVLKKKPSGKAIAWVEYAGRPTDYSEIYVNTNPFSLTNDDYNQFLNTLYHENLHIITRKGSIECDHAKEIYLEQMKHPSFAICSDDFKSSMFSSFGCYLTKCYYTPTEFGGGNANVVSLIGQANKIMKKYGWEISLHQDSSGFYCKIKNIKSGAYGDTNCDDWEGF